MELFPKFLTYGLRASMYLSLHAAHDKKVGIDEISEQLSIPRHFLAKVLQSLARSGLISSIKGPGGGFYLTDEQKQQPILDIMKVLEGPAPLDKCIMGFPHCNAANPCMLHVEYIDCRGKIADRLKDKSIIDMAREITSSESNYRL